MTEQKVIRLPDLHEAQDFHSGQLWKSPTSGDIFLLQAVASADGAIQYLLLNFTEQSIFDYHSSLTMVGIGGIYPPQSLKAIAEFLVAEGFMPVNEMRLGLVPQRDVDLASAEYEYLTNLKLELSAAGEVKDGWSVVHSEIAAGHLMPNEGLTMIGLTRLQNIWDLSQTIFREKIPGDFAECGVWKGGAAIFMRAILKAYGENRKVYACDSFAGFRSVDHPEDQKDKRLNTLLENDGLIASEEVVRENFKKYGFEDEILVKGYFEDTLKDAPIGPLALLRSDCDLYEGTYASLNALYPKVSLGGFIIVDDYLNVPSCRQAVDDYMGKYGLNGSLRRIDWTGVYWRKE
jgi:O-methyltransferase